MTSLGRLQQHDGYGQHDQRAIGGQGGNRQLHAMPEGEFREQVERRRDRPHDQIGEQEIQNDRDREQRARQTPQD